MRRPTEDEEQATPALEDDEDGEVRLHGDLLDVVRHRVDDGGGVQLRVHLRHLVGQVEELLHHPVADVLAAPGAPAVVQEPASQGASERED